MTGTDLATTNGNGRQLAPHQQFYDRLQKPVIQTEIRRALPRHVDPERFSRVLYTAVQQQPKLLRYQPDAVIREAMKVAQLGLLTDSHLGEAYIIPGKDGPDARIGYRGMLKLARQSGELTVIQAHAVHDRDEFRIRLGTSPEIIHEPALSARGNVIGYYAVAKFRDGSIDFEWMNIEEIYRIRDRSDGWKAFKAGRIKSTPWGTDEAEMSRKTALRRLIKRLPLSPDLATAAAYEDARDAGQQVAITDGALEYEDAPLALTVDADADAFERAAAGEAPEPPPAEPEPQGDQAQPAAVMPDIPPAMDQRDQRTPAEWAKAADNLTADLRQCESIEAYRSLTTSQRWINTLSAMNAAGVTDRANEVAEAQEAKRRELEQA